MDPGSMVLGGAVGRRMCRQKSGCRVEVHVDAGTDLDAGDGIGRAGVERLAAVGQLERAVANARVSPAVAPGPKAGLAVAAKEGGNIVSSVVGSTKP